jgi:predicted Na+-dependent transporter
MTIYTIPLIFSFLDFQRLSIDPWQIFGDLIIMVFVPMVASQILRRYFKRAIEKKKHIISPLNMLVLSLMVYIVIGSQRESLLNFSEDLILQLAVLYLIFILLHGVGYLLAIRQNRQNRISICIGMAYMNNGLAMVLAAKYFDPSILMLMLLSELPWDTLIVPFRKVLKHI